MLYNVASNDTADIHKGFKCPNYNNSLSILNFVVVFVSLHIWLKKHESVESTTITSPEFASII